MDLANLKFTRTVTVSSDAGQDRTGEIVIGGIDCTNGRYRCNYELRDIPFVKPSVGHISGEDPLQALLLCIWFLRRQMEDAKAYGRCEVWWAEPGDLAGLRMS